MADEFNPDAFLAKFDPDQFLAKFEAPQGAKSAFEAGQPGAAFYPDSGGRVAANPVSPVKAAVRGFEKGLLTVPFAGDFSEKVLTKTGLTTPEEFQATAKELEQFDVVNTPLNALGELAGIWASGKALGSAVNYAGRAVGAAAKTVGAIGNKISGSVVKLSDKATEAVIKRFGEDGIETVGKLLKDEGVTSTSGTIAKVTHRLNDIRKGIGSRLDGVYETADKVGRKYFVTPAQLERVVIQRMEQQAAEDGVELAADVASKVSKEMSNVLRKTKPDEVLSLSRVWKEARRMERISRKFERMPTEASRADVLNDISGAMRGYLDHAISNAGKGEKALKDYAALNREYSLFKTLHQQAYKQMIRTAKSGGNSLLFSPEVLTGALAAGPKGAAVGLGVRAARTVAGKTTAVAASQVGEGALNAIQRLFTHADRLGPAGKRLAHLVERQGLVAGLRFHANMMLENERYRKLVEDLPSDEPEQIPEESEQ